MGLKPEKHKNQKTKFLF